MPREVGLKCILGNFQCFEPFFFLVENRPIRAPPLLVENSTIFFFETFPNLDGFNPIMTGGGGHYVPAEFSKIFFSMFLLQTMVW